MRVTNVCYIFGRENVRRFICRMAYTRIYTVLQWPPWLPYSWQQQCMIQWDYVTVTLLVELLI